MHNAAKTPPRAVSRLGSRRVRLYAHIKGGVTVDLERVATCVFCTLHDAWESLSTREHEYTSYSGGPLCGSPALRWCNFASVRPSVDPLPAIFVKKLRNLTNCSNVFDVLLLNYKI